MFDIMEYGIVLINMVLCKSMWSLLIYFIYFLNLYFMFFLFENDFIRFYILFVI